MSLETLINQYKEKFKPVIDISKGDNRFKTWTRKCIKIADYQFGLGVGEKLFSNGVHARRNKRNTQIDLVDLKTREKLAVLKLEAGQILLTIKGAKKLEPFETNKNIIVFDGDKIQGNTLFRPGIIEFDSKIVPNSCVIILSNDKRNVIGVGQSIVGSNYIKKSKTGRVVDIYERIK